MAISFKGKLFKEINPDGAAMLRPELNPELDKLFGKFLNNDDYKYLGDGTNNVIDFYEK